MKIDKIISYYGGDYYCTVSNEVGEVDSSRAHLHVNGMCFATIMCCVWMYVCCHAYFCVCIPAFVYSSMHVCVKQYTTDHQPGYQKFNA